LVLVGLMLMIVMGVATWMFPPLGREDTGIISVGRQEGAAGGAENGGSVKWASIPPMLLGDAPKGETGEKHPACPPPRGRHRPPRDRHAQRAAPIQIADSVREESRAARFLRDANRGTDTRKRCLVRTLRSLTILTSVIALASASPALAQSIQVRPVVEGLDSP